jgi:hypothetical protein
MVCCFTYGALLVSFVICHFGLFIYKQLYLLIFLKVLAMAELFQRVRNFVLAVALGSDLLESWLRLIGWNHG